MKILEDRILKDGRLIEDRILKVDSFLNFQIDVELTDQMGREFARIFRESGATKVLTVETSGLPLAYAAARHLGDLPREPGKMAVIRCDGSDLSVDFSYDPFDFPGHTI